MKTIEQVANELTIARNKLSTELALTRNALSNLYHALAKETDEGKKPIRSVNVEFAMREAKQVLGE